MQRDLATMLQQKSHLAALGLAVSKINHDLRNLLASAQLFSDRLLSVADPNVQRFAPKLMRSLERAIAFCQSTLSYGQVREPAPERRAVPVEPLIEDVRDTLGLGPESAVRFVGAVERNLRVDADPDQLFRVILNLARNGLQALEGRAPNDPGRDQLRVTGQREGAVVVIEVSDTGPGVQRPGARAPVRGVPGLDPAGRLRPRPRDRGRAGAGAWRRDPPGRRHHRGDVPDHHSGPRGGYREPARGEGEGLAARAVPSSPACGEVDRPKAGREGANAENSLDSVRGQTACHAIASRPFAFTSARSLSDGPDGFFWPRSHSPTSFTATLRCRAKTLWLTPSCSRNFWISRAESGFASVRHRSSKSRMVRLSMTPASNASCIASCTSPAILLLYFFALIADLRPCAIRHHRGDLRLAPTQHLCRRLPQEP